MLLTTTPTPQLFTQQPGFTGMCEHIARCAAICYDSTPKEGEDAITFVKHLALNRHGRALEFGTMYIKNIRPDSMSAYKYAGLKTVGGCKILTINFREYIDVYNATHPTTTYEENIQDIFTPNHIPYDLFQNSPDCLQRVTIHYPAISRAVADEFRTHTTLSTLMRSTRYVDATKKGHMRFVAPTWYDRDRVPDEAVVVFEDLLSEAERAYHKLRAYNLTPQEARDVLPLSVETEMVQCGFIGIPGTGWDNFINLRFDRRAHPDAQLIASKIRQILAR